MRTRERIQSAFNTAEGHGVLDAAAPELILEVLLDIRDLLAQPPSEIIIDTVPPDYGKEGQL